MSSPASDNRPVIWIGTVGTGTGFGLVRSIREHWGARLCLVGSDINPAWLVAAAALTDFFVTVPPVSSRDFGSVMCSALAEHGAALYVPILDEEILWAAEAKAAGALHAGLEIVAPSVENTRRCFDKLVAFHWMREAGLPTIATMPLSDVSWSDEPLFAKPRCGRGSVGARAVNSREELLALAATGEDLVVQPRCVGPEVTVDAIRWPEGIRALARERLEVKSGVCTKARVFEDNELAEIALRIGRGLDLRGSFCFQVMRASLGGPWVITDINPRPGAGTRISVAAGVDLLSAMVADRLGEPVEPLLPRLAHECYVVRHYAEQVMVRR